jgi:hypothetical protein
MAFSDSRFDAGYVSGKYGALRLQMLRDIKKYLVEHTSCPKQMLSMAAEFGWNMSNARREIMETIDSPERKKRRFQK